METNAKPATSLPWHQDGTDICAWSAAPTVPQQEELLVASCPYNRFERDAAYIVTACNAYPQFVAALREARKALVFTGGDKRGTVQFAEIVSIDKLLRSLGEA